MIPFGASDHNLIGYTRYSKLPPQPSTTIRKRSYKNFDKNKFISDLNRFDWTDVYTCFDINAAVEMLTLKINTILDIHAPWVMYQKRKHHAPWLSNDTLKLMSERDILKPWQQNCHLKDWMHQLSGLGSRVSEIGSITDESMKKNTTNLKNLMHPWILLLILVKWQSLFMS